MADKPFHATGTTKLLACSTTNASVTFNDTSTPAPSVRVHNDGSATVWIGFGESAAVIPTAGSPQNGMPIGAGKSQVFSCGGATKVQGIMASGTANVYATPGEGGSNGG